MDRRNMYKAVIFEPHHKPSTPDKYGTLTVQPTGLRFGQGPGELAAWAIEVLPKLTDGAYCTIYRIDEVEVQQFKKEDVISASQTDTGSHS